MNQKLRDTLKRLDYNRDGKVDVEDAEMVLEEQLHGSMFRAALLGFVVGAIAATLIAAIF